MQRGARAAAGMISRSATRISRLAKTPTSSSSSSAATRLLHSRARFDDRTAGIVGFEPASGSQFYHSSLFPAIFLMGAFGAGSIQTSFADASVEDHSPYAVMDSQKNSEPVKIVASQERKRLEELLQSRRMERGSYPQFYLSVKGKKVTVKFEVPPACEWSHLIVDIVKNLGLSSENIGGGSAMLIRAWDSAAAWQLTLCPSEMKEASGEKMREIEFIKQGSFSSNELDTVVSALKIAGEKVDLRKSSGGSQKTFKKSYNHDKYVEKLSALEAMGVRVYGLDETSGVPRDGTISWENIAGYDEQKREIEDSILLALQSPEVYDDIARGTRRKFESNRPRAVLFEGPPGTGKTSSARVIAKQAGVPLLYVPLEVIMSKYYGESERLFGNVFSLANELPSGAIVFLDEVDSFATSRDSDIHEATRRILSVLLRQIDGFEQETQVVIIAATNRKQDLDPALLSRFDAVILFSLPDQQTREEIAAQYAKHLLKTELNLLASATEGMSGRDIRDVCQQAERHWASKLIRGQTSKDVEGTHKLPPIQEYLQCAEKRRETLFGVAALRESQSSRRWKPAALA